MSKMKRVLEQFYARKFPHMVASARLAEHKLNTLDQEIKEAMELLVGDGLNEMLPFMLEAKMFAKLHLRLYPALNTTDLGQILSELDRIEREVLASTWYSDGSYLKVANNVKEKGLEEHGNWMLTLIAKAIEQLGCQWHARFRQGDEFVMYHSSTDDVIEAVEAMLPILAKNEVLPGLPVSADFGYARHSEVAWTFKRLMEEGWLPKPGRTGNQVFFDIALKIAKGRSDVQKIYNRAWLLLELYREVRMSDPQRYSELEKELTRGGRFIYPEPLWLSVPKGQLGDFLRMETLAFLAVGADQSHFDRVVTQVAESIYLHTIVR